MHEHIGERKEISNYVSLNINFAMLKHTDVIHDWRVLVVRWLFMPFSWDFLVLLVKRSGISVKYKKLLNRTYHKHEPQSSLA